MTLTDRPSQSSTFVGLSSKFENGATKLLEGRTYIEVRQQAPTTETERLGKNFEVQG
jgi:hypothetical protein